MNLLNAEPTAIVSLAGKKTMSVEKLTLNSILVGDPPVATVAAVSVGVGKSVPVVTVVAALTNSASEMAKCEMYPDLMAVLPTPN